MVDVTDKDKPLWGLYPTPTDGPQFQRTWWFHAPWAHPIWKSYAVLLYDLTTPIPGREEPIKYKPNVTHEVLVLAQEPSHPVPETWPPAMLNPPNHGYQFEALNDISAEARIQVLIERIVAKEVNPDTDFRQQWDILFADGVTLLSAASLRGTRH